MAINCGNDGQLVIYDTQTQRTETIIKFDFVSVDVGGVAALRDGSIAFFGQALAQHERWLSNGDMGDVGIFVARRDDNWRPAMVAQAPIDIDGRLVINGVHISSGSDCAVIDTQVDLVAYDFSKKKYAVHTGVAPSDRSWEGCARDAAGNLHLLVSIAPRFANRLTSDLMTYQLVSDQTLLPEATITVTGELLGSPVLVSPEFILLFGSEGSRVRDIESKKEASADFDSSRCGSNFVALLNLRTKHGECLFSLKSSMPWLDEFGFVETGAYEFWAGGFLCRFDADSKKLRAVADIPAQRLEGAVSPTGGLAAWMHRDGELSFTRIKKRDQIGVTARRACE